MIADAAPRDVETVRGFGADHVVERGAGIAERIRALVNEGVAGVVDGSAQTAELVPAISDGGTLVELRGWPGPAERGLRVCPVIVPDRIGNTADLDTLCRQAETGVLTPRVAQVLPAAEAKRGHRLLEACGLRDGVVLDFP
ncbi:zinc-binding dehydrogenase [Streptomyces anulatus]|uniref:zinc-binding dehydrogenase n=1 Tax=Streptomyces anulatus TaxID=1892 RepID=UPI003710633A